MSEPKPIREIIDETYRLHRERNGAHGGSEVAALLTLAEANVEGARFVAQSIDRLTAAIESVFEDMEASKGRRRK
jgi:hypothetical protein